MRNASLLLFTFRISDIIGWNIISKLCCCAAEEEMDNLEEVQRTLGERAAVRKAWTYGQGVFHLNIITILIIHVSPISWGPAAQWEDDVASPQRNGLQRLSSLLQLSA